MVIVNVPLVAVLVDVTVIVELPEVFTLDGLNETDAPLGWPVALNETVPVKPPVAPMVTVNVVDFPRLMLLDVGEAVIVKFGEEMVSETVVVCVADAPVPVIVNV
jgi:hypothetical protein